MVRSGSSAYIAYGYEAVFRGGATITRLFGKEQKGNGLDYKNNQVPLGQLYTPEVKDFLYGRAEGSVSMEYVLSNPFIFTSILHDPTSSAVGGVTTWTWTTDPDVNANIRQVKPIHLEIGFDAKTADVVRNAKGVICPSINLKSAIDQPVGVTQPLIWGYEDAISTTLNPSVPSETNFTPYNFVSATVELPDGTPLATLQSFDITLNPGSTLFYPMGGELVGTKLVSYATDAYNKLFEITGRLNLAILDKTNLQRVVDRQEIANMSLLITNGQTGTSLKSIELLFEGVGLSTHTTSGIVAPPELVLEDLDLQCRSLTVTAKNDVAP